MTNERNRPRRILMVAYHFPPIAVSSGLQRSLSFANRLADAGWEVTVLTVSERAYESVSPEQVKDIHPAVKVVRAFCLDTQRHLSIKGRYLQAMALPDRWMSWILPALVAGLWITRRRHDAIWSTYPIPSAHLIASKLSRWRNIPLVADFRDPMFDDDFPNDPMQRRAHSRVERGVVAASTRMVFTTESTRRLYLERYPELSREKTALIENGYEEAYFRDLSPARNEALRTTLLHSGVVYPEDRDPTALFDALARLKARGMGDRLRLELRASGDDEYLQGLIAARDLQDMVELLPRISYPEAIAEMVQGKSLLVLQGPSCNHQIPAKVYEYLRSGSDIIALTPEGSDTAQLLRRAGVDKLADIDDVDEIEALLVDHVQNRGTSQLDDEFVKSLSRDGRAQTLLRLLEDALE